VHLTRSGLADALRGQVLLAPLTKGGNLPYRRLCVEQGALVTFSEMVVARRLVKRLGSEHVLLRTHESEPCFGVQLAARRPDEAAAAARLAVERGARFVDLNCGCPIHQFCAKGLGAALLTKPGRLAAIVRALREAVDVPLFVKIRTGYKAARINAREVARRVEDCGADALTVHGRTREQRYRRPADWDLIAEIASELSIPVIGNGDLLHGSDARRRLDETPVTAVMAARGALIQPWLWSDLAEGVDRPRDAQERLAVYRRWVELALETWGADELGFRRTRQFLEFHVDFWRRYVPPGRQTSGGNTLQSRTDFEPADDEEAILMAPDPVGLDRACNLVLAPFDAPPEALRPSPHAPDPSAGGWA
jgi:tRNA-dihydrouridine synthase 3